MNSPDHRCQHNYGKHCYNVFIHLDEYLDATSKGLWKADLSWSRDAHELRKAAVASQERSILKRAKKQLMHLRIIDKKVYVHNWT